VTSAAAPGTCTWRGPVRQIGAGVLDVGDGDGRPAVPAVAAAVAEVATS
jgi:hypothetical protein